MPVFEINNWKKSLPQNSDIDSRNSSPKNLVRHMQKFKFFRRRKIRRPVITSPTLPSFVCTSLPLLESTGARFHAIRLSKRARARKEMKTSALS